MNNNIFFPSFNFEKKTKSFNKILWGFVSLISMFTVGAIYLFHLMLCSVFDIKITFISDDMIIFPIIILFFGIVFGVGLIKFLNSLMYSYKIENNTIIKGKLMNPDNIKGLDLALNTVTTTYMISNIKNPKKVMNANTLQNFNDIFSLIKLNMNKDFVGKYFDTDLYKKRTYINTKLLKETKYSLIYVCDNNKKIKIPKIYEGMNITLENPKGTSLISRILIRSLIVFLLFLLFSICDLSIGYANNPENILNILKNCPNIEYNLNSYGYVSSKVETCSEFKKDISETKTSIIKYFFDKKGNIKDVDFEIYFNKLSNNVDNELYYIIKSLDVDFSENDINRFISNVNISINDKYTYDKLVSKKHTIIISTSAGFIQVHN